MKIPMIAAAAAALALSASISQATVINSSFTSLGGNSWLADFTLVNDGKPANFAGFTIDFPNATNLKLVASPSTWDSAVFQQDPSLPDDAFLDSFLKNPSNVWAGGSSIGGFGVSFSYTAGARPGALPFLVYSDTYVPLFAGTTTAVVAAVPEPASVVLMALGLAFVGWRGLRASARSGRAAEEVAA